MSLITDDPEKSPRDCSRMRHHHGSRRRKRALIVASSTVASLLSLAVILWLALHPTSPHFSLLAATATNNGSVIVVDAAFTARNPNAHAAALYDQLQASASYAGVPLLGASSALPPVEQPEGDDVVMSALLKSPWTAAAGTVDGAPALLRTRIQGQLRWKVGAWVSGRHGLAVDCVAVMPLQPSSAQGSSSPRSSRCATHVLSK